MAHQKFKTCRRCNTPGDAHPLTFTCFRGQPFLDSDRSRRWLVDAVNRAREVHQSHVWAWVIMPEHVHLLLRPTLHEYSVSAWLTSIKQPVIAKALSYLRSEAAAQSFRFRDEEPDGAVQYRFWQRGGGYDRNVTEPRTVWAEIDYLHTNPVRRRLCRRPEDWVWSSAREMLTGQPGLIPLDKSSMPLTDRG